MKNDHFLYYIVQQYVFIISLSLVLTFTSTHVFSACSLEPESQSVRLADSVQQASYIFQGRVTQIALPQITVQVSHYFKGNGPAIVEVNGLDENNCGELLTLNQEAIFFGEGNFVHNTLSLLADSELSSIQAAWAKTITDIIAQVGCMATYHPDEGKVKIPCLSVPQSDLNSTYYAELSLQATEPVLFSIKEIKKKNPTANIDNIEIQISNTFPVQVKVQVEGQLPTPCHQIDQIDVVYQDNTFNVAITTEPPPEDVDCPAMLKPFEELIDLDVTGFQAGVYTVDVNGVSDTFELTEYVPELAKVEAIDIQMSTTFPVTVQVSVEGLLPTPCHQIDQIDTVYQDNTFNITLTTAFEPPQKNDGCLLVLTPFEELIDLEVGGFQAGVYTVNVNGVSDTFELITEDVPELAKVDAIDIQMSNTSPVQVQVQVEGQLPTPCHQIDQIEIGYQENTFNIFITTAVESPEDLACPTMLVPFNTSIELDVIGLQAGVYTVNVNGVSDTFKLTKDSDPKLAPVESIEIQMSNSFPVQVNVLAKGTLPTPCHKIDKIKIQHQSTTFNLTKKDLFNITMTIAFEAPPELECPSVLVPFEEKIHLDVIGLKAGIYTVKVNGISDTFELTKDNISLAIVENINVQVLEESVPVQVQVTATGYFSDGCQQIEQVDVMRTDNLFTVTMTTTSPPPEIACPTVLIPFEKTINLDVKDLQTGTYTVDVNGKSATFELTTDHVTN